MAHAVVKEIPQPLRGDGYAIDFEALGKRRDATERACCSTRRPRIRWAGSRPTQDQDRLLDFARRHGLWLIADEVYERLYYGARESRPRF